MEGEISVSLSPVSLGFALHKQVGVCPVGHDAGCLMPMTKYVRCASHLFYRVECRQSGMFTHWIQSQGLSLALLIDHCQNSVVLIFRRGVYTMDLKNGLGFVKEGTSGLVFARLVASFSCIDEQRWPRSKDLCLPESEQDF